MDWIVLFQWFIQNIRSLLWRHWREFFLSHLLYRVSKPWEISRKWLNGNWTQPFIIYDVIITIYNNLKQKGINKVSWNLSQQQKCLLIIHRMRLKVLLSNVAVVHAWNCAFSFSVFELFLAFFMKSRLCLTRSYIAIQSVVMLNAWNVWNALHSSSVNRKNCSCKHCRHLQTNVSRFLSFSWRSKQFTDFIGLDYTLVIGLWV